MDKRRATVIDLARAAGVSKSTVSLVLQGRAGVHSETRAKVKEAIRELGYIYDRRAANLRQSAAKSKIVGVIVNDLTNAFFAELAVGIDEIVQSADYVQFLSSSSESLDRQQELIVSMQEHGISGLILSPARGTRARDLKSVLSNDIPVVLVVRDVPGSPASVLKSDNAAGAREATEFLLGLGHRRIAFLGGFPETAVHSERVAGYRAALEAAGLAAGDHLVVPESPSRAGGAVAMGAVLSMREPPTAAICFNDAVAFGACDGLRAKGLEPGRDFGIVGFDDVIEARTAVPSLTTVSVDPQGMGRRAATLLLKQINARTNDPETVITSVRLVVRDSSGLPRAS